MKLLSWNVNGLRACLNKGFLETCAQADADVICLQETKMRPDQAAFDLPGYQRFWNSADKAGYSGTAVFTRPAPLSIAYDFGDEVHRHEGRVITAEYPDFYLVCCYTPNSKDQLLRLDYRMEWEDAIREYLMELDQRKPVVYCGDLNVAHQEIDIKNPKTNRRNAGFTDEEREKMTRLLDSGFADTFRRLHPDAVGAYTWWSYRFNARKNNAGWRIDYFIVSERLLPKVRAAEILSEVQGSDHCPVVLELEEGEMP
ncbi:MAG: exodeoxyribonuclease III [Oscillibacter sp.]|nr:exodeoxyribonuclease III [Oscillibacter sp.]